MWLVLVCFLYVLFIVMATILVSWWGLATILKVDHLRTFCQVCFNLAIWFQMNFCENKAKFAYLIKIAKIQNFINKPRIHVKHVASVQISADSSLKQSHFCHSKKFLVTAAILDGGWSWFINIWIFYMVVLTRFGLIWLYSFRKTFLKAQTCHITH